jgi:hypothetical protein
LGSPFPSDAYFTSSTRFMIVHDEHRVGYHDFMRLNEPRVVSQCEGCMWSATALACGCCLPDVQSPAARWAEPL